MSSGAADAADPFSGWPERTALYDESGELVLVFTLVDETRDGRPWIDGMWRPPEVDLGRAIDEVLATFTGYAVSTSDADLASRLLAAGAAELRHAHSMSYALATLPVVDLDPSSTIRPLSSADLDTFADDLGAISVRAYPVGHPDHEPGDAAAAAADLQRIGRGEALGPYLGVSQLALIDGEVVGACLVVDREGVAPWGGPWIIDVFRDPDVRERGVGTALIVAVLRAASDDGLPSLSLVVSHANASARRVYSALGFTDADESWTLALP